MNDSRIKEVVIIASYLDMRTSLELASQILAKDHSIACIIVDDSPIEIFETSLGGLTKVKSEFNLRLQVSHSDLKKGRGRAIRRGMKLGLDLFPEAEVFLEMDGDGSHRKQDVVSLLEHPRAVATVIGSRYLAQSQIVGWSVWRKMFSRGLNLALPRILKLPLSDFTNGLRRYSRENIRLLLDHRPLTDGFIYLSETLLVLRESGAPDEIPIIFENRSQGESSVGIRELWASFKGLLKILRLRG